jgi:hypothetical protein
MCRQILHASQCKCKKADNSYIECDSTRMKEKLVSIVFIFLCVTWVFHLNQLSAQLHVNRDLLILFYF